MRDAEHPLPGPRATEPEAPVPRGIVARGRGRGRWRRLATLPLLALSCGAALAQVSPVRDGPLAGGQAKAMTETVTDDRGRQVALAARPLRIVSLAPHATEALVAAGALDRLVAVDPNSDYPPAVHALPRITAFPTPDLEALAAMRPDLVVLWGAGARQSVIDRIEALGIQVFVSDPRRLSDVVSTLDRLAPASPSPAIARAAAREFDRTIATLRERYRHAASVPVFVQIGLRPLMTLSDRDSIGDALRICGARNVFGELAGAAATVGAEAVIAAAPSLIVSTEPSRSREPWQGLGVLAPRGSIRLAWIGPAIHRPGPRLAAQIEQLCTMIDVVRGPDRTHVSVRTLR